MNKWGLNIGIIITIAGMFIGGVSSYVRMTAKAEDTASKVIAAEKRIDELEDENNSIQKIMIEQNAKLTYTKEKVEEINENLKLLIRKIR